MNVTSVTKKLKYMIKIDDYITQSRNKDITFSLLAIICVFIEFMSFIEKKIAISKKAHYIMYKVSSIDFFSYSVIRQLG